LVYLEFPPSGGFAQIASRPRYLSKLETEANGRKGKERLEKLRQADVALDKVRHYLRLAARWKWLSGVQYRHAAAMAAEVGRLLGGWIKQTVDALGKTM